jgi:hypothetical protein
MATAKVTKSKGKHKARSFSFERGTKGGFVSRTEMEQPKSSGRGMGMNSAYAEPEVTPHPNLQHMQDHIASQFGDQPAVEGQPGEAAEPDADDEKK